MRICFVGSRPVLDAQQRIDGCLSRTTHQSCQIKVQFLCWSWSVAQVFLLCQRPWWPEDGGQLSDCLLCLGDLFARASEFWISRLCILLGIFEGTISHKRKLQKFEWVAALIECVDRNLNPIKFVDHWERKYPRGLGNATYSLFAIMLGLFPSGELDAMQERFMWDGGGIQSHKKCRESEWIDLVRCRITRNAIGWRS